MPDFSIEWDERDRRGWDTLQARLAEPALEQSFAHGEAMAAVSGNRPARAVIRRGSEPFALAQALVWRPVGPLTIARLERGPCFMSPPTDEERAAVFRLIRDRFRKRRLSFLFWMPELPDAPGSHAAMRALGLRRVVTGYSSVVIDLTRDEAALRAGLHQKWRNQLVAGEGAGLRVRQAHGGAQFDWLLNRHEAQRRRGGLPVPHARLVRAQIEAQADRQAATVFTAQAGGEAVAAILVIRHGRGATYHIAYATERGRAERAHNLLLWRAVLWLRERGVERLDLGGVDGLSMEGVSRFKMGLGGRLFTLAGTFL